MGASEFTDVWRVGNGGIREAFGKAVNQAQYDYGHAGYTGTIAEKDTFTFIKEVETRKEAMTLAESLINDGDERVDDKWGPAGAITFKENGNKFVLFFGWASD